MLIGSIGLSPPPLSPQAAPIRATEVSLFPVVCPCPHRVQLGFLRVSSIARKIMVVAHSRKQLAAHHRITTGNVPDDLIFNFPICQVIFHLLFPRRRYFNKSTRHLMTSSKNKNKKAQNNYFSVIILGATQSVNLSNICIAFTLCFFIT